MITQIATAVLALINALMLVTGTITFEWLFILGLGGGTASALGMPARSPLMAQAVGPNNIMSAMAMSNAAMNATRLFGPAVAGAMAAIWSLESVYFLQAILYVLSFLILFRVPTGLGAAPAGTMAPAKGSMFGEIGKGLKYVATDPRLRLLNGMMFIVSFFAMPYVMLLAGFVHKDLGGGDAEFGILQSVSGVGALVGSLGIAMLTAFDRKGMLQWMSGILGGLGLIGLAAGSAAFGYGGAVVAILVLGLSLTVYQTLNSTMIMDACKPEYYGRVMSINMLSFSAMPLMAFPMGELADVVGARETFIAQGLIVIGFMLVVVLSNPQRAFARIAPRAMSAGSPGMRPGFRPGVQASQDQEEPSMGSAGGS